MKIYLNKNVYEQALDRIRWLFDEFPYVLVSFSGGKDSTTILNLALQVAREKDRLPLRVMFLDQEAEWQTVIDYIREIMYREDVIPMWYQVPIKLFNATSHTEPWLYCWDNNKKDLWMREKEPISIKENYLGTDRFHEMLYKILPVEFPGQKACFLSGVRTEESPARLLGMTADPTYKYITWGKKLNEKDQQYTFYPIYDWSYKDVWKAIHDNGWDYCKLYDYMYSQGVTVNNMRVSNLHHETAVHALYYLQEVEAETWNKLTKRLGGVDTTAKISKSDNFSVDKLPWMFESWQEYRDYLLENLIQDDEIKEKFRNKFKRLDEKYGGMTEEGNVKMQKVCVNSLLANDYTFTKIGNMEKSAEFRVFRKWALYGTYADDKKYNKYIPK